MDANDVVVPSVSMESPIEQVYGGALSKDGYDLADDGIHFYSAKSTVNITTTNSGLKNIIRYIYSYLPRKSVSSVVLSVQDNGYLAGTMEVDFYCMTGTEIPYQQLNTPAIITGTDNIFGARTGNGGVLPQSEAGEGEEGVEGTDEGEEDAEENQNGGDQEAAE